MFALGKKIGMSQIFNDKDESVAVTAIEISPFCVVEIKKKEDSGYSAVKIAYGSSNKRNKPLTGFLNKVKWFEKNKKSPAYLKEFKVDDGFKINDQEVKLGQIINVSIFKEGDKVKVSSNTKAKGFQGVVKRHNFAGAPASHGHKGVLRAPGSIGMRFPQHTLKGKRMPGRMGGKRVTTRGLKVVRVDEKNNLILVKGAVPGHNNALVEIRSL